MSFRRSPRIIGLLGAIALMALPFAGTAGAHGTGVVKSCQPGKDCIADPSKNAVFAVCKPQSAATTCNPGRDVTIQLRNFGANKTVKVWWLNSEVDDPSANDCSQAVGVGRTPLPGATTNTSGAASVNTHLPPAGGTPGTWSYGTNWICATTDPNNTGTGVIGDQQFAIYPV